MKKITRIALVGFMALSSIFLFNSQVRAELTPCLDNYVYPGPGLVHLSPCTVNIDMVDGAGNVPINVMLVDQNSGYGGYTGYEIEQPTGFPEYGLSKNVSSGVIVGQTSIGFTAIDSVLAASGTQPRIYNGKVDIHLFRGTSLPDGNNVTLYINIKVYPAGSTIPPKTNVNPTLSAISVVSTSEDYVSGDGFSPDGWADWKLNFNLAANSEKSIRRITIANNWGHGNYGSIDVWSTGLAAAYPLDGMPVYPLLVTSGGYTLPLRGDIIPISNIQNQTYTLYAPVGPSGPAWTGGNLFVEFTDGTRITADLPASNAKPINKPSIKTITPTLALVGTQVTLTGVFPDVNSIRLTPAPSGNGYQVISPVFSPDSTHLDFSVPNEYSSFNGNVAVTVIDSKGQISNSQSLNIVMSTSTNQIISRLDPSSPPARTAIISPTTVTDNVVLGVFDFKSQNKDATLRSIKFKVWTSTSTIQTAFNTIKIKVGSTTYYPSSIAQSGAYAVVTYTNLAVPMPASQFVPIIVYGTVAPDRTGVMNGTRVAVNILASNSTVYADDATFTQVPVAQTELTSSDLTFATAATKSITLNKLVLSSSYHVGDIIPIKWSSTNVNNVVINLMNYKGLSVVRFIASSTASVGQYNWTVPSNIDFNYDTIYTIAVSDAATPSIISKSGKIELLPATPNASPVAISNQVTSFVPLVTPNGTTGGNATFAFTLTAGSNPIYISRTASGVMTLVPVGMTVSINSVTAEPAGVSGDSNSSFVIPAGTSRRFTYNAFLDNSNGTTGQKLVSIQSIIYGMTAANPNGYQISSGLDNLKLSVNLNSNGTPPPVTPLSARLTVEGQHTYTYTVGQTNHIAWLGSGPSGTVYSSYSKANDVGKCGEGAWVANNAQGTSNTYLGGQWAGCIWTITYVAKNPATGQMVSDTISVNVVSQAPQQPVSVTNTTTTFTPMVNQSGLIGGAFTMSFTLSAGSNPLSISKTASGVMFSVPVGLALSVSSISADPVAITSDSPGAYVIPAGSSRRFTYAGSFDNSNGTTGAKIIQINSIVYGTSSANPTGYQISTGLEGLKIVQTLVGGAVPTIPSPTASITIEGQKSYTYTVGQTNHFVWSGSGPSGTVYSSYSKANDVGKCGEGAWVANNAQGTSNTYLTGQWAGCTWTVTYVATNPATGQSVQDSVTVSVVSQPTPPPTSTTTSYYPSNYGAAIINALTRLLGL